MLSTSTWYAKFPTQPILTFMCSGKRMEKKEKLKEPGIDKRQKESLIHVSN